MTALALLDLKNRTILHELDLNARATNTYISKKAHLTKEAVAYRVSRLEADGVITGYFTIIDVSRIGFMSFRIFLGFQECTPAQERDIHEFLKKHPAVGWFASIQGTWDLNVITWVRDIYDFADFWSELLRRFGVFIERYWISIFTKITHFNKRYLLSESEDFVMDEMGQRQAMALDSVDIKVLKVLSGNARASLVELERKTGLNYKVIAYRMKRLEENRVILRYRVAIDLGKLGYRYYKLHFYLHNINEENLPSLERYVIGQPSVVFLNRTIGGADLELDVQTKDETELREFIEKVRSEFPDLIRRHEVLQYYQEHKVLYLPHLE